MRKKTVPLHFKLKNSFTLTTLLFPFTFSSLAQGYAITPGMTSYLAFTCNISIHCADTMAEILRV
jgi:hypothetical protein